MARYIDAERLRDRVKIQTNPYGKPTLEYASGLKVLAMIDQEPTADVVEVVRCKDCKYYTLANGGYCKKDWGLGITDKEQFCSYGERSTDENKTS